LLSDIGRFFVKKAFLLAGLFAFITVALFTQNTELPRLAVVEFIPNPSNEKTRTDSVTVRNLVESQMVGTRKYQIITRDDIDKLLANQRIQVSSISSAENLKKLQLQNISYIVTGSVDAMDNDYAITVRVLDVSTGQFSHSDNALIGSSSRDLYNGINSLMAKFVTSMSSTATGVIVQGTVVNSSGISIDVSTYKGVDLFFQGNKIATLWDNDTHTIPIENPGVYSLHLVLINKDEKTTSVTITSRGVTKVDFTKIESYFPIGGNGPAGGIVFYDKGRYSDGWRYLEAAPARVEFRAAWGADGNNVSGTMTDVGSGNRNTQIIVVRLRSLGESNRAAQICAAMDINGYKDWFLPSRDELRLMYTNLKQKGLGEFSNNWYWSSSDYNIYYAGIQDFSNGVLRSGEKNETNSVRAVRAF
jgi:hypothetical protein